jgi:integrase
MGRRTLWSKSYGDRAGAKVRVYEVRGGMLYAERRLGGRLLDRKSLGHRDRDRADTWATVELGKLKQGHAATADPTPTVAKVFAAYLTHATPRKGGACQVADRRCAALWTRVLGATKDLAKLTRGEWEAFADARRSGAITAQGEPVPDPTTRAPVRQGTVRQDLLWLKWVLAWAVTWQDARTGAYLMRENPARGEAYTVAKEPNPRRPVATHDRFEKIRAVAARVTMEIRVLRDGRRRRVAVASYLPELLDLVNATGRRLGAVLQLRYEDVDVGAGPHGGIVWPADTDKRGKRWAAPLNAAGRAAIDRVLARRPGIGKAYLFPSPRRPDRPLSKDLASAWLERAEVLAKVPKQEGSLWHAYRRKWATERKHLPDVDVAQAGGWSDLTSLKTAYQHADDATLYRVVSQPAELREARA